MLKQTEMVRKIAVRFAKTGRAIHHSHHDLIRFWERAVRRAGLPCRLTQGFNPRPRLIFPHALGVGVASRVEEVELELYDPLSPEEVRERLGPAAGGALEILSAFKLPPVKKSRQVQACSYRISGWPESAAGALPDAVAAILARPEIRVLRGAPGERREVDVRPYIMELTHDAGANALCATLAHTPTGSGRVDEIARTAATAAGCEWGGLTLEKTGMTIK